LAKEYLETIHRTYNSLKNYPELPFPSIDSLGLEIPPDALTLVNITEDFVHLLKDSTEISEPGPIKVLFPHNINSVIVTHSELSRKLLEISIHKLRRYLQYEEYFEYMQQKLAKIFQHREIQLKQMLQNILGNPGQAIESIFQQTDFSSPFWSHFASSIIQEYKEKEHKSAQEHSFCQAAYFAGYFNSYYKIRYQKQKNRDTALQKINAKLRKPPYLYSLNEITHFKDTMGYPLTKYVPKKELVSYLREKTTSEKQGYLPEFIRIHLPDENKDYFFYKENIFSLLFKRLYDSAAQLKQEYIEEFTTELDNYNETPPMEEDMEFEKDLQKKLNKQHPILYRVLNFNILYLAYKEIQANDATKEELERILDTKNSSLIALSDILGLSRDNLVKYAQFNLPFWKTLPLIKNIAAMFHRKKKQKQKKKKQKKSGEKSTGDSVQDEQDTRELLKEKQKKAFDELRNSYLEPHEDLDSTLEELIEKWNPLIYAQAKKDLTEDINSLVRDYLRVVIRRNRGRIPDKSRINQLADRLMQQKTLQEIRHQQHLKQYITLYMLKLLDPSRKR